MFYGFNKNIMVINSHHFNYIFIKIKIFEYMTFSASKELENVFPISLSLKKFRLFHEIMS